MSAYNANQVNSRKVVFYGVTGSGKSVASKKYADALGVPWISADEDIVWLPNWDERDRGEQDMLVNQIVSQTEWVIDGAVTSWRDIVFEHADLIIALDYPRWVSMNRLIRRTFRQFFTREPICNGNRQQISRLFGKSSIILWHFQTFSRKRKLIADMYNDPKLPPVLIIRRPQKMTELLDTLQR